MNATTGMLKQRALNPAGPKHSQAMIKNRAPIPRRMLSMRALRASNRARRALRSARRVEYCSDGDTKKSLAHFGDPTLEARSIAGFLFLPRNLGRLIRFIGITQFGILGIPAANFVVVEIAHQFGGAPLFHDPFQAPPSGLGRKRKPAIDLASSV